MLVRESHQSQHFYRSTLLFLAKHFSGSTLKTQGRPKEDYKLSRMDSYLVTINGDPRKPEIASAQSYFVIKTREAETVILAQSDRINLSFEMIGI